MLNCSIKLTSYDQFCVVDVGLIMALLRWICSCRIHIIIQESNLETTSVPKSLHVSMASFFVFVRGYHHWPLNEEFRWCSTSDHLFTPDGLYLDILEIIDINDDFPRTC